MGPVIENLEIRIVKMHNLLLYVLTSCLPRLLSARVLDFIYCHQNAQSAHPLNYFENTGNGLVFYVVHVSRNSYFV